MSKELTPELKKQISQEAQSSAANFHYYPGSEVYEDMESAYETGATKYALKWQEAEQKIKELTQWKKEASWLLDPLLEWGQGRKDIPLGNDITKEILRRAKLFTEGEQKAERYEKALFEIQFKATSAIFPHLPVETVGAQMCIEIEQLATRALTPKQTTDDYTVNG